MGSWPLVGRLEELAYLDELIGDPECSGGFLAGEAGVGKTRLLAEVTGRLASHHVERVTATRSAQLLPFGALAHLLPESMAEDRADHLAMIGGVLRRRSGARPIVLAVDDAHLLDPMSAAFVHHAATTGLAKVVLSARSGEAAPDAIVALYRDGVLARLELQPISRSEFDELVGTVLGGHVEAGTLERLWTVAAGNVLYVHELILDAAEAGTLVEEQGLWRWAGRAGNAPRLREIVFGRLGQLSANQRQLLDLLAIAEPLGSALAEQLAPSSSLADAERQGLIAVETDNRRTQVRLGHPLFAEALLLALPNTERRRIHHALADALQSNGARRGHDSLQLATWRLEAGDEPDSNLLTAAARVANALGDFTLGERLARAATTAGGGFDAALQLGRALSDLGQYEEAEMVLRGLIGIEPTTDADREALVDALVAAVGYGQGRTEDALAILIDAEEHASGPQARAFLQMHRATLLAYVARFAEAAALGDAALAVVGDDETRVRALTSVGVSLVMAGQIDRALAFNDEMFPIALELADRLPRALGWILSNRITALLLAGRFDEALALMEFARASLPRIGDDVRAWEMTYRGRIALAQGKPATAQRLLTEAVAALHRHALDIPVSWCLSLHAEASALVGDTDTAAISAQRALDTVEPGYLAFDVDARRARAWVSAAAGRTSDSVAQLLDAADTASSRGQTIFELLTLSDALRLGEHSVARRTADLADATDGPWTAAIGEHATAILENDAGLLESAASAFEAIGSHLVAAELLAAASIDHNREGLRARSAASARRSQSLLGNCESVRSPALEWTADPVPLSRREREVATMAAAGSANTEIAAALHVSVRTVESHLYATFAKLGVADRRQLATALGHREG